MHALPQEVVHHVCSGSFGVQQSNEDVLGTDCAKVIRNMADALRVRPEVHLIIGCMKQEEVLVRVDGHVDYADGPLGSGIQ